MRVKNEEKAPIYIDIVSDKECPPVGVIRSHGGEN